MFLAGDPLSGFGVLGQPNISQQIRANVVFPGDTAAVRPENLPTYYNIGPFQLTSLPYEDDDPITGKPKPGSSTYINDAADAEDACSNGSGAITPVPRSGMMMTITDPSLVSDLLREHIISTVFDETLLHPALSGGRTGGVAAEGDAIQVGMGNYWNADTQGTADPWWKDKGRYGAGNTGFDITKPPWWDQPKLAQSYRDWITALGIGQQNYNRSMISIAASGVDPWNTFGPLMSGIPLARFRGPYLGALADGTKNPGLSIWDQSQWTQTDNPDVWPDSSDPASPQRPWMEWAVFLQLRAWGTKYGANASDAPIFGCSSCYPVPETPLDSFFVLDVIIIPVRDWYNYAPNSCIDVGSLLPKLLLAELKWFGDNLTQLTCDILSNPAAAAALAAYTKGQTNTLAKSCPQKVTPAPTVTPVVTPWYLQWYVVAGAALVAALLIFPKSRSSTDRASNVE